MGRSGKTYAIDSSGLLISDSRFYDQLYNAGLLDYEQYALLSIRVTDPSVNLIKGEITTTPRTDWPLTTMAAQLTDKKSGINLEGYRDYRGVPVVGAWIWDEALNFGIACEIDIEQGHQFLHQVKLYIYRHLFLTLHNLDISTPAN